MQRSRSRFTARDEPGQAIVLIALMLLALVALVGLVVEGGHVFAVRRDLQNVADAAALAAAQQLDLPAYRASRQVRLDPEAAERRAYQMAHDEVPSAEVSVQSGTISVTVTLRKRIPTVFLGTIGVRSITLDASASAVPRGGSPER